MACIYDCVVPGTKIIHDDYCGYKWLRTSADFTEGTVMHKINFVCPRNTTVHTQQHIEATWKWLRHVCRRGVNQRKHIWKYICELVWRNDCCRRGLEMIDVFLE